METEDQNTGLYIHIPFCLQKCPYCDFVSFDNRIFYADDYIGALAGELNYYASNFGTKFSTLFIGGGTPACLTEKQLDYLFSVIYRAAPKKGFREITIEANPETVTEKKARVLAANVNRVSLGAQSFNDNRLKILGRAHSAAKTKDAVSILKNNGIENINLDLMFGIPGQKTEGVIRDIETAAGLSPAHISFYMLTLNPKSSYAKFVTIPEEGVLADMYLKGVEKLETEGFFRYEISNFAKPGKKCAHNLNYWGGGRYAGLGVSASSYFNGERFSNTCSIEEYIKRIKRGHDPAEIKEKITGEKALKEYIMLALRKTQGVNLYEFKEKFGFDFAAKYSKIIENAKGRGLMKTEENRVCLTRKGMLFSNSVIKEFF